MIECCNVYFAIKCFFNIKKLLRVFLNEHQCKWKLHPTDDQELFFRCSSNNYWIFLEWRIVFIICVHLSGLGNDGENKICLSWYNKKPKVNEKRRIYQQIKYRVTDLQKCTFPHQWFIFGSQDNKSNRLKTPIRKWLNGIRSQIDFNMNNIQLSLDLVIVNLSTYIWTD